jgi:hypothetical protein
MSKIVAQKAAEQAQGQIVELQPAETMAVVGGSRAAGSSAVTAHIPPHWTAPTASPFRRL